MKKLKKILSIILAAMSLCLIIPFAACSNTAKLGEVKLISLSSAESYESNRGSEYYSLSEAKSGSSFTADLFDKTDDSDLSDTQYTIIYKYQETISFTIKLSNPNNYYIMDFKLSCEQENVKVNQGSHWSDINDPDTYIRWDEGVDRLGNREATFLLQLPNAEVSPTSIKISELYYSDRTDGTNKTAVNTNGKDTYNVYKIDELFEVEEKYVNNVEGKIKLNVSDSVDEIKVMVNETEYRVSEDGYYHLPAGDMAIIAKQTVEGVNKVVTKIVTDEIKLVYVELAYIKREDSHTQAFAYSGGAASLIFLKAYYGLGSYARIKLYKDDGSYDEFNAQISEGSKKTDIYGNEFYDSILVDIVINRFLNYVDVGFVFDDFELRYPLRVDLPETIIIPDGTTNIADSAYAGYKNLTSVTIPDSVTGIGSGAFKNCTNLTNITFNGTMEKWNAIRKGSDWNSNVPSDCVIHCSDGDITIN